MDISDPDFSTMQDIPPLCRYHDTPRVTDMYEKTENGVLGNSLQFNKQILEQSIH